MDGYSRLELDERSRSGFASPWLVSGVGGRLPGPGIAWGSSHSSSSHLKCFAPVLIGFLLFELFHTIASFLPCSSNRASMGFTTIPFTPSTNLPSFFHRPFMTLHPSLSISPFLSFGLNTHSRRYHVSSALGPSACTPAYAVCCCCCCCCCCG